MASGTARCPIRDGARGRLQVPERAGAQWSDPYRGPAYPRGRSGDPEPVDTTLLGFLKSQQTVKTVRCFISESKPVAVYGRASKFERVRYSSSSVASWT